MSDIRGYYIPEGHPDAKVYPNGLPKPKKKPLNKKIFTWKTANKIVWISFALVFFTTIYGNYHYPHGRMIDLDDVSCNDYGGGCHENYKEDTRYLNVPSWVKYERADSLIYLVGLGLVGWFTYTKAAPNTSAADGAW